MIYYSPHAERIYTKGILQVKGLFDTDQHKIIQCIVILKIDLKAKNKMLGELSISGSIYGGRWRDNVSASNPSSDRSLKSGQYLPTGGREKVPTQNAACPFPPQTLPDFRFLIMHLLRKEGHQLV